MDGAFCYRAYITIIHAAMVAEHAHYLFNKEITTPN